MIGSRMVMGQSYPVQAHEKRRTPELAQSLLQLWLRDSDCTLAARQQIEAVHPRPVCRVGEYRSRMPSADQQEHGRRITVNDLLKHRTGNPTPGVLGWRDL